MENLNYEYLLLAFLGMFIHILMKIGDRDKKSKLSFKKFISTPNNWVRILLSVTSVVALIMMADDISDMLKIKLSDGSPAKSIFAFGAGYLNHSLIRNVLKIFGKGVETNNDNN